MSRRATLPGADELFRRTSDTPDPAQAPGLAPAPAAPVSLVPESPEHAGAAAAPEPADQPPERDDDAPRPSRTAPRRRPRTGDRRPTGREKHDEKITVYVSPEELVDLERAKLTLRAQHSLAVDRGRIVREALSMVIADLEAQGEDSILVRRLRGL
jgi:hypothetical protein